ncbi:hypothetical protein [Candidatus Methylobacter favarea]|uniref:hypothetical protein n=1 Tax=Candidatus Methylobacter favarea TaxID=2707345 RepID=UPI001FE407C8|nr:hypothetical protein [Candidatus Methylobacter favarea]
MVNCQSLILVFIAAILSGCASPFFGGYGPKGQSRKDFARYVEHVFRLQNNITSRVMMMLESESEIKNHDALLHAEQEMQKVCSPLNEYASRDSEGLSVGLFLQRRVESSAADCEQAAQTVKSLLEHP